MENNFNITANIIEAINTILSNLFSSIDESIYSILDDITFVNSDIINDSYFEKILGTSTSNGILLIANSLLFGVLLYYSIKLLFAHFTYQQVENPKQFIFKLIIWGICINSSYFFIEQFLNIISNISLAIRSIGEDLFHKSICFSELISELNSSFNTDSSLDIFSLDGIIKASLTTSLLNLVFTYSFRYVMLKIFILLTPFAILSLVLESTSWFFLFFLIVFVLFIFFIINIVTTKLTAILSTHFNYLCLSFAKLKVEIHLKQIQDILSTFIINLICKYNISL